MASLTPRLPQAGRIAVVLGGAALVALVAWAGAGAVAAAVLRAGWTLPLLLPLQAVQLWLSALAWRDVSGGGAPGGWAWLRIRWIRESVNSLLPVAQIGGVLVGVRLLRHRGVPLADGGAGAVLDMTMEAVTQFAFTLLGIAVLANIGIDPSWRPWLAGVLGLSGLALAGFVLAQRAGLLALVERLVGTLGARVPALLALDLQGMHATLMRLQTRRGALLRAGGYHLTAWLLGAAETWLVLGAIGHKVGAATALGVESIGMAARSVGFAVPGALGVQEGGYVLVGSLVGVPAEAAVALSVVKRAREVLAGLPGLLAWQWAEGARLTRRAGD